MDIIKLAGGICGGVLVKDYALYKNGTTCDTTKTLWPPGGNKITFQWLKSRWYW